jgi:hypothetical protein
VPIMSLHSGHFQSRDSVEWSESTVTTLTGARVVDSCVGSGVAARARRHVGAGTGAPQKNGAKWRASAPARVVARNARFGARLAGAPVRASAAENSTAQP